jgi:hypothetical protein
VIITISKHLVVQLMAIDSTIISISNVSNRPLHEF